MENPSHTPVEPVRPLAPYVGGKRGLAKELVARIAAIPHDTYAEVFVGMGGVFLRRTSRPKGEVINDWSGDVATLFRVVQRHYAVFVDMIRYQVTSRKEFERLANTAPETLTDLERAARFLYLQKTAFGGKVRGRNFGVVVGEQARFDVSKIAPMLEAVHERLAGVVIECLPYDKFLERYDRPKTLFYLDPPYFGTEGYYGPGMFSRSDFERLAGLLQAIKGRFLLSLNDAPEVREIFKRFAIEGVETNYSVNGAKQGNFKELIISGP